MISLNYLVSIELNVNDYRLKTVIITQLTLYHETNLNNI